MPAASSTTASTDLRPSRTNSWTCRSAGTDTTATPMLLAHALFREAYYGDTEEPGKAITSVHHKDSIAKEGDCLGSAALTRAMHRSGRANRGGCCADLVATASVHGLGPPLGKPRRSLVRLLRRRRFLPAHRDHEHWRSDSDSTCWHDRGHRRLHRTCELVLGRDGARGVQ